MENNNDEKIYYPSQAVIEQANVQDYDNLYTWSVENPEEFWAGQAEYLSWYKKWDKVLDKSNPPFFKWFEGGKTNIILLSLIHISEPTRRTPISYAVFCLKKKKQ